MNQSVQAAAASAVRHILILLLAMLVLPLKSLSQTSLEVSGTVLDAGNRQPLPGALISVAGRTDVGAVSDPSGHYTIRIEQPDVWLVCSFLGMTPDSFRVTAATQTVHHDFLLKPAAREMHAVVVSASRYEQNLGETVISMQVLPASLIENRNTVNIKSVLEQSPGLVILDEEPQMRGGSGFSFGVGSRVATLIDGLPIMTGDAGRTDWSFIPVESIDQIEIVEGASSVLYGSSALSGTINFRTRFATDSNTTYVRAYTGLYSTPQNDSAKWWNGTANFTGLNFSTSSRFNRLDLVVGGQFNYDHNYIGPYILDGSLPIEADTLDNSDVANRSGRLNFGLRYRPASNTRLQYGLNGNVMHAHTNFSLVWGNSGEGIYRAYPGTMTLSDFTAFYLDPFITYVDSKSGSHQFRGRWYFSDNDNNNGQGNQTDVLVADYSYTRTFKSLRDLNVTGGLYFMQSFSSATLYAGGGNPDNQLKNRAAFLQLSDKIFDFLQVTAGIRGEYYRINDEKSEFRPIFRSGINARISRGTYLRASYGQGYRFPTIAEKFITTTTGGIYVFPNPGVKPESSWSLEAGLKQGFRAGGFRGFADAAWFRQEYRDMIEYIYAIWQPDSAGFKFVNTGNSRVQGFEVSVMGEGKLTREVDIRLLAGYTYVLPQTLEPNRVFATDNPANGILPTELSYANTSTDTTNNILKYRFRHLVKGDVEFTWKRFTVGLSARYYSFMQNIDKTFYDLDQPYLLNTGITAYREEHNSGELVFDGRIGMKLGRYYQVMVLSNNLTNLEYCLRPLKIESPRTFTLQVTARF